MAAKVVWTEVAGKDLADIADYIAKDSASYAAAFVREILAAARSLSRLARRGRRVPEVSDPSVRELLVGNYRLVYQVSDQQIFILALIHGARDLAALWNREKRPSSGSKT